MALPRAGGPRRAGPAVRRPQLHPDRRALPRPRGGPRATRPATRPTSRSSTVGSPPSRPTPPPRRSPPLAGRQGVPAPLEPVIGGILLDRRSPAAPRAHRVAGAQDSSQISRALPRRALPPRDRRRRRDPGCGPDPDPDPDQGSLLMTRTLGSPPSAATPLSGAELKTLHAYWRAANYLSVGQIYLLDNPLLREPLRAEHVKPRLLGHWGTTPGLNFIYAHMNRVIKARDLDAIYVTGPGHGGPGLVANTYLEGTYTRSTRTSATTRRGCAGCSASSPSRAASPATSRPRRPDRSTRAASSATRSCTPIGAAFDNPDLLVCCVVGDGEAETGPLAAELALQQVPQPRPRRRGAADPASQRLQDRQPHRARADPATTSCARCSRATATRRASSRAPTPRRCTS